MAKNRARTIDPDQAPRDAFVLAESYDSAGPSGEGPLHSHGRAQLIHVSSGVVTVRTKSHRWVVPPQRAVWIPGGVAHALSSRKPFRLLTLYATHRALSVPDAPCVVAIDGLVQELLAAAARFGPSYPEDGAEARLVRVLLDRLPTLKVARALSLPEPASRELARITASLRESPADGRTFEAWAKLVKLVPRTAARRFVAETGLTFGQWRTQLRLHAALVRLGEGESVTAVAFEVGYADVSSFIAAFKAQMGETPARYFRAPES
jgi:AraC-like DNA-binding protein